MRREALYDSNNTYDSSAALLIPQRLMKSVRYVVYSRSGAGDFSLPGRVWKSRGRSMTISHPSAAYVPVHRGQGEAARSI